MKLSVKCRITRDIVLETIKGVSMRMPFVRAWRLHYPRTSKDFREISQSDLDYFVFSPMEMLLKHVAPSRLAGATIVEIGPGDNIVMGIPLLAMGVSSYHAIDPFMGDVDSENAHRLYKRVAKELPRKYHIDRGTISDPDTYPRSVEGKSVFLYRKGIEEYRSLDLVGKADIVFSHVVGQYVASAEAFAQGSYEFLKKGGIAIHRIDFGPSGCWDRYNNPLTFLTVSEWLWRLTGSHRGIPNRVRFCQFQEVFEQSGFDVNAYIFDYFTKDQVEEISSFLAAPFSSLSGQCLSIMSGDFVCIKSENTSDGV